MATQPQISKEEIISALARDARFGFKNGSLYLTQGCCPSCNKRSLFVSKKFPYVITCNHRNRCGYEAHIKELCPELFEKFGDKYKPTQEEPARTANAYLGIGRGFDLSKIRGWYEQGSAYVEELDKHFHTVRFYLDEDKTRWWERLIDVEGHEAIKKAHFGGKRKPDGTIYQGDAWTPPGQTLEKGERCFLVEGVFKAIALHHCGYKVAALLSCNNYPANFIEQHKGRLIRWVWALDGDNAGKEYMPKFYERIKAERELSLVLLLPPGPDWDDLYRMGRITPEFIEDRLYHGRLFMAKDVADKARIYYTRKRTGSFILEFKSALYQIRLGSKFNEALAWAVEDYRSGQIDSKPNGKPTERAKEGEAPAPETAGEAIAASGEGEPAQEDLEARAARLKNDAYSAVLNSPDGEKLFRSEVEISKISNVYPRFLYMERDVLVDEQRYMFSIDYANGQKPEIIGLSGNEIDSSATFHKALLNRSKGGTFDGDSHQLKIIREGWLGERMLMVQALPYVGYEKSLGAYIFQDNAFHKGRHVPVNSQGYFKIKNTGVKTTLQGVYIKTDGAFSPTWLPDYFKVFHWPGLALLAFWLGSLFVQQIRSIDRSFTFFEFTGEAGAGKSTALEFLWKCLGRDDYEGFDLFKATTAGRRRAFSQVSNLPVVIIESDRDSGERDAKQRQFNFDEVKPFYNGRGTGTLGVARRNNDVEEHLFQASLIISQNAEVEGSEALLQRIVHCHVDKKHHGPDSRELARWFEQQSSKTVGGFLRAALTREQDILTAYKDAFGNIEQYYSSLVKNQRLVKNHAQVAALGAGLAVVFGRERMTDELRQGLTKYLGERARAREERLSADHPLVEQFWEQFEYLNEEAGEAIKKGRLNHSANDRQIAVNLSHFKELAARANQAPLDMQLLKKLLPLSRRHKFIESNKTIRSALETHKTIKCWIFQK